MDGQARFIVARGLALILSLWGAALATGQAEAVTSLELADLDGSNGFVINGIAAGDGAGHVSDAGDINDDGIDDFIIGAAGADPNGLSDAGQTYVIFGTEAGFPATLGLADLDGSNGFTINGLGFQDLSGAAVSGAGDINGDGIDDLLIGAYWAAPNGSISGQSYVVFGNPLGFPASLELADLDGSNGFAINGVAAYDQSGISVSGAGDVNADGVDDVLIGAVTASPNGVNGCGQSYVVFGRTALFPASLELADLDGSNGFAINGIAADDWSGYAVSGAGDLNGDDIDDVIIGAQNADPNGDSSGQSYVVFGSAAGFAASLDLAALDGSNGFAINGIAPPDSSGFSVSDAGDFNGDGLDDVLIGAMSASANGIPACGQSYVLFGTRAGFPPAFELADLDGSNGLAINGVAAYDWSGFSVSGAGDMNGDGIGDVLIGAPYAYPNGERSGQSYVVFGTRGELPASFELAGLDGTNGFAMNGIAPYDYSGRSVSGAGDVNGDGVGDLVIGASSADPNGDGSGQSYIVFGTGAPATGADLTVVLSDSPDPLLRGSSLTYFLEVTNEGPEVASGVAVELQLPKGFMVLSIAADPAVPCESKRHQLRCEIDALAADETTVVTITVVARRPGLRSATATVSAMSTDPDVTNNVDVETTTVLRPWEVRNAR